MLSSVATPVNTHPTLAPVWPGPVDAITRRTLICPRVSSGAQASEGASMETQEIELRAFCEARGLEVVERLPYVGTATLRRQEFWNDIYAGLGQGRYHVIMFWEASRMSRRGDWDGISRLHQIEEMGHDWYIVSVGDDVKRADSWNWRSHILSEHFNTARRFIVNLKEAVARGQKHRLAGVKGRPGRPVSVARVAQGLAWHEDDGVYRVVEGRADWGTIEAAYDALLATGSLHGGARALNAAGYRSRSGKLFSATTLSLLIRNPIYKGEVHAQRWEAYYDEETETRRKRQRPVEERTILEGIVVRDPACGDLISRAMGSRQRRHPPAHVRAARGGQPRQPPAAWARLLRRLRSLGRLHD